MYEIYQTSKILVNPRKLICLQSSLIKYRLKDSSHASESCLQIIRDTVHSLLLNFNLFIFVQDFYGLTGLTSSISSLSMNAGNLGSRVAEVSIVFTFFANKVWFLPFPSLKQDSVSLP